ncbi:hypothetical protein N8302_05115, partial [Gammaproteobacteria bacterium]|nr:hypothetical protein [Gammaproteobacteria bacterium]
CLASARDPSQVRFIARQSRHFNADENHYQLDLYLFFDIFSFAHNNTYQIGISSTCLTAHRSCLAASELTPQQLTLMR